EREDIECLAFRSVPNAELDGFDPIEHVELGDAQSGYAVDLDRTLECRCVEPSATARTAGDRAEFLALFGEMTADLIEQFGRERARADPCGVSLGDSQDVLQALRPDPRPRGGGAGHAVA